MPPAGRIVLRAGGILPGSKEWWEVEVVRMVQGHFVDEDRFKFSGSPHCLKETCAASGDDLGADLAKFFKDK